MKALEKTIWLPRYYYIMKNLTTGKLYVGQRQGSIDNYLGSGPYWKNHCAKHGGYSRKNVQTLFFKWFEEEAEAQMWLDEFEKNEPGYYLKENTKWANQVPETTETCPMATTNPETIEKMKATRSVIQENGLSIDQEKALRAAETKTKTILPSGLNIHEDAAKRGGETQKSEDWIKENWKTCEHCGDTVSPGNYSRWHGDNCKMSPEPKPRKRKTDASLYKTCEKCGVGPLHPANYARWHGDKCRK